MEGQPIEESGTIRTDGEVDELQKAIDNLAQLEPIRLYFDSPVGNNIGQLDIRPNASLSTLRGCVQQLTGIINPILVITIHGGFYRLEHDPKATLAEIGITAGMDIIVHSYKTIIQFGDAILPLDTVMFDNIFEEENERAIAEAVAQDIPSTHASIYEKSKPLTAKTTANDNNTYIPQKQTRAKNTFREHIEKGHEKFSYVKGESNDKMLMRYQKWVNKIYATCDIPWVCKLNDLPFGVPGDWKIPPPYIYKIIYPSIGVKSVYEDIVGKPMFLPPDDDVQSVHKIYESNEFID